MAYFPVYLGKFTLLNFVHSKVEAESLGEIKLVDIEHRKHDPYQIINKHVAQCGLKAYEHEDSFYDDIFKNAVSYDEVQNRVQTLSPDAQVGFASFQRNRRQCLPKILQGEVSASEQESETIPPGFETITQYDASDKDKPKNLRHPLRIQRTLRAKKHTQEREKEYRQTRQTSMTFPKPSGEQLQRHWAVQLQH
jgi:hypothetical protein